MSFASIDDRRRMTNGQTPSWNKRQPLVESMEKNSDFWLLLDKMHWHRPLCFSSLYHFMGMAIASGVPVAAGLITGIVW